MIWSLAETVASGTAEGKVFYVAPWGDDQDSGDLDAPWETLAGSVPNLRPGDTLYLRGGTYREEVEIEVSGTASDWITIDEYPGEEAVIESGTVPEPTWELVNPSIGEYRSSERFPTSGRPMAHVRGIKGYTNERVKLVPYLDLDAFRSTTDEYNSSAFYVGPGIFQDGDGRIRIRLSKTADMRASEARYGTVFEEENADPAGYDVQISTASVGFDIKGSYVRIKNIEIGPAGIRTVVLRPGVHHIGFDGVTIWSGQDSSIDVVGGEVHDVQVINSRLYGDAPDWIFWSDMKDAPEVALRMKGGVLKLRKGTYNWEVAYSHIRGAGQDLIGVNDDEDNIRIHHSRIENCADDAFELEGKTNVGRIEIDHNFILNCLTGAAPGQDTERYDGPLFFHHNVVALLRNPPVNRREGINTWNYGHGARFGDNLMFKQSGKDYTTSNAHYYYNTLIMLNHAGKGINIIPHDPRNTRVANNIMILINGRVMGDYLTGSGQFVDGNLYWKINADDDEPLLSRYDTVAAFNAATGLEANGIGEIAKRGTDPLLAWRPGWDNRSGDHWELNAASEVPRMSDFIPRAGSPVIGAAVAIPAHPAEGALPGATGSDIGAIPHGTDPKMFDVFPFNIAAEPRDGGDDPPPPPPDPDVDPTIDPTIDLTVTPSEIDRGDSADLEWTSTNADDCIGAGFSTGGDTSGSVAVSPMQDTTYSIECSGNGGSVTANVLLDVVPPSPTVSLSADPDTVRVGGQSTLTWTSTDADNGCVSIGFSTGGAASGSVQVSPTQTTDYSIECLNETGSAGAQTTLTVTEGPPQSDAATVFLAAAADTYIRESRKDAQSGNSSTIKVDDGSRDDEQGLIRFDVSSIPSGATIQSAVLHLYVRARGDGPTFHRMLVPWTEAATWDTLVDGVGLGPDAQAMSDVITPSKMPVGSYALDMGTASVQAWVDGSASNFGWAVMPTGTDGIDLYSRERSNAGQRPSLEVRYVR